MSQRQLGAVIAAGMKIRKKSSVVITIILSKSYEPKMQIFLKKLRLSLPIKQIRIRSFKKH